MSTLSHESSVVDRKRPSWLELREMWASLAISVMWLAVIFVSIFGPDFKSVNGGGNANVTIIPSGVIIALFALIGTVSVAKYGLRERPADS